MLPLNYNRCLLRNISGPLQIFHILYVFIYYQITHLFLLSLVSFFIYVST